MDIATIKTKVKPILIQAGATKSALFGSYSRGEQNANSDIDILVELPNSLSLFDFVDLKLQLEDSLQRKVDLVEYESIKPLLKEYILKDQVEII